MVIVFSGLMIQTVWHINWYMVFIRAGEWEWEDAPLRSLEFMTSMLLYVGIASGDCITMRYSKRVLICSLIMLSFLAEFVAVRFKWVRDNFFADETLDWWLISTTPDEIYLSSKLQLLLFLGKTSLAYARGQPFSCLKADYLVPGRHVLVEQVMDRVTRQLSDAFTPSSCRSTVPLTYRRQLSDAFTPSSCRSTVSLTHGEDICVGNESVEDAHVHAHRGCEEGMGSIQGDTSPVFVATCNEPPHAHSLSAYV